MRLKAQNLFFSKWMVLFFICSTFTLTLFQNCTQSSFTAQSNSLATDLNGGLSVAVKCQHPDSKELVSVGYSISYFAKNSGVSQSDCDQAKKISVCNTKGAFEPAVDAVRYSTCQISGLVCSYSTGAGLSLPTGTGVGDSISGYSTSSAIYPNTCGTVQKSICQANGTWSGSSALYQSCSQKCLNPDNNNGIDPGSTYSYYTINSGTQAQCDAAKVVLTCNVNSGQLSGSVPVTRYLSCQTLQAPVITSFTSSASTITAGGSATLSWSVTGATQILLNNEDVTSLKSKIVTPTMTTTYSLIAKSAAGMVSSSVTITVNPVQAAPKIASFSSSAATINNGESVTLSWSVTGATQILLNNEDVTSVTSKVVSPTVTTSYGLVAKNSAGSVSANLSITVNSTSVAGGCSTSSGIAQNFPCNMYFNTAVDQIALTASQKNYSDHLINGLNARGWGNSNRFQVDFSIDVYEADTKAQPTFFNLNIADWADADTSLKMVPAPPANSSAGFESSGGRSCDGGDCHYLVLDKGARKLYEFYRAEASGSTLATPGEGSFAVWPFDKVWTEALRGDVCTSADASGLSIGAMLFSAEEIQSGAINHAIRFILPNTQIAYRTYVRPATHTTGNTSGWAAAPTTDLTEPPLANPNSEPGIPYGSRLRLKASYDISKLTPAAQVVAKALKKYGMILADGGQIALTAKSDSKSSVTYDKVGFTAQALSALKPSDFEVVPPITPTPFKSGLAFQPTVIGPMIKVKYLDCYLNVN